MKRTPALLVALFVGSLAVACQKKVTAPPPEPPPPAPLPATPQSCGPVGLWNLSGPNDNADKVEVIQGDTPDTFIVKHHSNSNAPGVGTMANQEFKVDMKQSMGLYSCKIADDCNSMTCNFAGIPATMQRAY